MSNSISLRKLYNQSSFREELIKKDENNKIIKEKNKLSITNKYKVNRLLYINNRLSFNECFQNLNHVNNNDKVNDNEAVSSFHMKNSSLFSIHSFKPSQEEFKNKKISGNIVNTSENLSNDRSFFMKNNNNYSTYTYDYFKNKTNDYENNQSLNNDTSNSIQVNLKQNQIKSIVNTKEKERIQRFFKSNHKTKSENSSQIENKIRTEVENSDININHINSIITNYNLNNNKTFASPELALFNNKINKLIHEEFILNTLPSQTELYMNFYNKSIENSLKQTILPVIKKNQFQSRKIDVFNKDLTGKVRKDKDLHIGSIMYYDNCFISLKREYLSKGVIDLFTIKSSNSRPSSRIGSAICIYQNYMILFGGLQDKRYNDMWICNLNAHSESDQDNDDNDKDNEYMKYGYKTNYTCGVIKNMKNSLKKLNKNSKLRVLTENKGKISMNANMNMQLDKENKEHNKGNSKNMDDNENVRETHISNKHCLSINNANKFFSDLSENNNKIKWKRILNFNSNCKIPEERSGHSMVLYDSKLYIYGGKTNSTMVEPIDLMGFDLKTLSFFYPDRIINSKLITKRYNHGAISIKGHMLIHGGIENITKHSYNNQGQDKERTLSDCFLFNFNTHVWEKLIFCGDELPQVSGHNIEICIIKEKVDSLINEFYKGNDTSSNSYSRIKGKGVIKEEGVYFYGGKDNEGNCNSNVGVLKIFKKPCEFFNLEIYGRPPKPRYASTFNFYEKLNICILYGGRNNDGRFFNDVFILDLENIRWVEIRLDSSKLLANQNLTSMMIENEGFDIENEKSIKNISIHRACHVSCIFNDKLFIFGGMNDTHFSSSEMIYMNLELQNSYRRSIKKGSALSLNHSPSVGFIQRKDSNFFKGKIKIKK